MRLSLSLITTVFVAIAACGPSGELEDLDSSDPGSTPPTALPGSPAETVSAPELGAGTTIDGSSDIDSAGGKSPRAVNAAQVTFSIDLTAGPARQFKPPAKPALVSSHIYGINGFGTFVAQKTKWGLIRQGGNAFTAWNWTNNYSNSGADYCFWEGPKTGGANVVGWLTAPGDSITAAQAKSEAYLATVPIMDFVSANFSNNVFPGSQAGNCPGPAAQCGGSAFDENTGNIAFASVNPKSKAFVANSPTKGKAFCTCAPGKVCAGKCNIDGAGPVFQDEFANYMEVNYGGGAVPLFFELDNEPNYWGGTHPELWPFNGNLPCQSASVSYDQITTRNIDFAKAVRSASKTGMIFGPVVAQDGMVYAHSYGADPHHATEFLDYYLGQMEAAGKAYGSSLLDALDVHYYSNNANAAQCLQNPRLLWDPNYKAITAAATDAIDFGWAGLNNHFDTNWYPRQLVPRLLGKIDAAYGTSGMKEPGLAFTEYNSGCESQIEGGVAEADDLGVFGREGVFAATVWPLASLNKNYLVAAFDLYRNYDGQGTIVGNEAVKAATSDVANTSIYAFTHASNANAVDLVAINKTAAGLKVAFTLAHAPALASVKAYELVGAQAAVVAVKAPPTVACANGTCTVVYTLPATSATTLILR